jgi:endonuclease-8
MRLRAPEVTIDLTGPTACTIGTPEERAAILARLGPDPLRRDARPEMAIDRIRRSRRPLGALLLDQSVLAGVGNVYRAEALFVHGIHPARPGTACDPEELGELWDTIGAMLRDGVRANRIVTVRREELDLPRGARIPRAEATYVYRRDRCLRCGDAIARGTIGNRTCYWCPTHQPS